MRTINKVGFLLMLLLLKHCEVSGDGDPDVHPTVPDDQRVQYLNALLTKLVTDWGFQLRTYEVVTDDGYILKIHHVFKNEKNLKPPILLMHGIKGCSANFLANRKGLAYYLAEKGYDVWVGNARGSAFSLKHKDTTNFNPEKSKAYWDFSFHEIGYFDLPEFFRKIKKETGANKVHYAGMSMGSTMFLVMACTRPSVMNDVATVTLLAPVACPRHFKFIESNTRKFFIMSILKLLRLVSRGDIYTHQKSISWATYKICSSKSWIGGLCEKILRFQSKGKDLYDFENSLEGLLFFPCGSSVKSFQHFIQLAQAEKFQQFDYGEKGNKAKYKQNYPPEYDLGSINKKLYLLVGGEDDQADKRDVKWLHDRLPRGKGVYITERFEHFDHRDFEYGIEMHSIHETVLEVIKAYEEGREPKVTAEQQVEDQTSTSTGARRP